MNILKKITLLLMFISWSFNAPAQQNHATDTDTDEFEDTISFTKHHFSVEIGVHRSLISGKRYYTPPSECYDCSSFGPPWSSTRFPTTGFQLNLLYDYIFYKNFSLRSGLYMFNRPSKREIDTATIPETYTMSHPDGIYISDIFNPEILKYDDIRISIEIPIYIGYEYKNLSLFFGIKKPIISYSISKRTKIDGTTYKVYSLRQYIISFNNSYYDIKLYYLFKNSFHDFSIYIGADSYGIDFWDYNYLQIGLNIPLSGEK